MSQDGGVLAFLWKLVRPSILAKFKFSTAV
eukprot:SAG31_NODE_35035_length_326_cov_61.533040_1_plen_29_part_10